MQMRQVWEQETRSKIVKRKGERNEEDERLLKDQLNKNKNTCLFTSAKVECVCAIAGRDLCMAWLRGRLKAARGRGVH